jgi:nitrogen fixation/metabolism regulation signal transduction histidine kinase
VVKFDCGFWHSFCFISQVISLISKAVINVTQKNPFSERGARVDLDIPAHDQAVRLMATWIAAIADQIKNPVAGISAAAELIEREMASFRAAKPWDPAIVEEAVRLMVKRLGRFNNYLTELSGFTRPADLRFAWHDLRREWPAIELYLARHISSDYRLTVSFHEHPRVYVDLDALKAILAAVILNAVEACGAVTSPEISVTTRAVDADNTRGGVFIQLRDNGPGFSPVAAAQALVPFFTTKEAGTGLGLAMVDKYARAHDGWVRVGTDQADGGIVELFFPNTHEQSNEIIKNR